MGILLYIMLCGYPPFFGSNDIETTEEIKNADINFESEEWDNVSNTAINLIKNMLEKDTSKR